MIILKKAILQLLICTILLCGLFGLSACENYNPKTYSSKKEVQEVFYQNEELFNKFANTLSTNIDYRNTWDSGSLNDFIKPNNKSFKKYFNQEQQQIIKEFFNVTSPYRFGFGEDRWLWIEYDSHEGNGWFPVRYVLIYYFDKTTEYKPGETYYELDLQSNKNWVQITPDWFFKTSYH